VGEIDSDISHHAPQREKKLGTDASLEGGLTLFGGEDDGLHPFDSGQLQSLWPVWL
jgi:hypothetical protein